MLFIYFFLLSLWIIPKTVLNLIMNDWNLQRMLYVSLANCLKHGWDNGRLFRLILKKGICICYFQTNLRTNLRWLWKRPAKTQPRRIKRAAATAAAHLTGTPKACTQHMHVRAHTHPSTCSITPAKSAAEWCTALIYWIMLSKGWSPRQEGLAPAYYFKLLGK